MTTKKPIAYYIPKYFLTLVLLLIFTSFKKISPLKLNNTSISQKEVILKIEYKFLVDGNIKEIMLNMVIPKTKKGRQTVKNISYSIKPDSVYSKNENTYAFFRFNNISKDFKLVITGDLIINNTITKENEDTIEDLSKYLIPEKYIEVSSKEIKTTAAQLKQKTDIETTINTFEFVGNKLKYELKPSVGAEQVLENGVGKCTDFSDLFVALLRSNNIPAKTMGGIIVDFDDENPLHAWSEVYFKKQGWVRFDPTFRSPIIRDGINYKMKIDNRYIDMEEGRWDSELNFSSIYYYKYFRDGHNSKLNLKASFKAYSK